MTKRTELEGRKAEAMAAYRRATLLAADGDEAAKASKPTLWVAIGEAERELRDYDIVAEGRRQTEREEAAVQDRIEVQAAIARGEDALAERVVVARRLVSLVTQIGTAVTEWERLTAIVRASVVSPDERTANALHAALHPAEPVLAGLLGRAVPALTREDVAWQAHHCAGLDWPAMVEAGGARAAAVLRSQLRDEPLEAA